MFDQKLNSAGAQRWEVLVQVLCVTGAAGAGGLSASPTDEWLLCDAACARLEVRTPEAPADYCTGTRTQSVFIRKRSKIIQESSGPLIHLKRQMRGRGEPRVILKEENPEEQPWESQRINTQIILTQFFLLQDLQPIFLQFTVNCLWNPPRFYQWKREAGEENITACMCQTEPA